jgi:hypothetical protein
MIDDRSHIESITTGKSGKIRSFWRWLTDLCVKFTTEALYISKNLIAFFEDLQCDNFKLISRFRMNYGAIWGVCFYGSVYIRIFE